MKRLNWATLSLLASLAYAGTSWAADDEFDEEPRWFEIEIIVFKSTSQNGLFEESWDSDVELTKPENLVDFLQPFEPAVKKSDENPVNENLVNEKDLVITDSASDSTAPLPNIAKTDSDTSTSTSTSTNTSTSADLNIANQGDSQTNNGDTLSPADADSSLEADLVEEEQPFVLLDESLLQLTNEVKSLNRHPEYQVILHHAWRQPVLDARQAPHIRIAGGLDFSDLYEYDGTRKLAKLDLEAIDSTLSDFPEMDRQLTEQATRDTPIDIQSQLALSTLPGESVNDNSLNDNPLQDNSLNDDSINHDSVNKDELTANDNAAQANSEPEMVPSPWVPELDGDIKVYLGRYLHVRTNLYLRRPDKEEVEIIDIDMLNNDQLTTLNDPLGSLDIGATNLAATGDITEDNLLVNENNFEFQSENDPFAETIPRENDAQTNDNLFELSNKNNISESNNSLIGNNQSQFSWEIGDNFLETESEKMYIERLFNYPVNQSRRMRSGELHFFDHPLVGVLVMIRPYERNQEVTEEDGILPPSL